MFLQFFVFHEQQILKQGNVDLSTTLEMTNGGARDDKIKDYSPRK